MEHNSWNWLSDDSRSWLTDRFSISLIKKYLEWAGIYEWSGNSNVVHEITTISCKVEVAQWYKICILDKFLHQFWMVIFINLSINYIAKIIKFVWNFISFLLLNKWILWFSISLMSMSRFFNDITPYIALINNRMSYRALNWYIIYNQSHLGSACSLRVSWRYYVYWTSVIRFQTFTKTIYHIKWTVTVFHRACLFHHCFHPNDTVRGINCFAY